MPLLQVLRVGLALVVGAAYLWLGHQASISTDPPLVSLLIGLAPLSASAVLLAWHSRSVWLIAACALGLAAMLLNLEFLRGNVAWVYFIQHAGMHGLLGIMFGRTLGQGDEAALCSRMSRFVHPRDALDARFFRYTWRVTLLWTLYFSLTTLLSALLFFFGPLEIWSVYANLLTPVLIGLVFVAEYAVRLRVLPRHQQANIAESIRAYREYSQNKNTH